MIFKKTDNPATMAKKATLTRQFKMENWNDPSVKMSVGQRMSGAMWSGLKNRLQTQGGIVGNTIANRMDNVENPFRKALFDRVYSSVDRAIGGSVLGQIALTTWQARRPYNQLSNHRLERTAIDEGDIYGTLYRMDSKLTDNINQMRRDIDANMLRVDQRFRKIEEIQGRHQQVIKSISDNQLKMAQLMQRDRMTGKSNDWLDEIERVRGKNQFTAATDKGTNSLSAASLLGLARALLSSTNLLPLVIGGVVAHLLQGKDIKDIQGTIGKQLKEGKKPSLSDDQMMYDKPLLQGGAALYRWWRNRNDRIEKEQGQNVPRNPDGSIDLKALTDKKNMRIGGASDGGLFGWMRRGWNSTMDGLKGNVDPKNRNPHESPTDALAAHKESNREFEANVFSYQLYSQTDINFEARRNISLKAKVITLEAENEIIIDTRKLTIKQGQSLDSKTSPRGMSDANGNPPGLAPPVPMGPGPGARNFLRDSSPAQNYGPNSTGNPQSLRQPAPNSMDWQGRNPAAPNPSILGEEGSAGLPTWLKNPNRAISETPDEELKSRPKSYYSPDMRPGAPSRSDAPSGDLSKSGPKELRRETYEAFRRAGFPHDAALMMTGEIGRENSFDGKTMFGNHIDSSRWNSGIMSWNSDRTDMNIKSREGRRGQFLKHMDEGGHLESDGHTIKKTREALQAQVNFLIKEMETGSHMGGMNNAKSQRVKALLDRVRSGEKIDYDEFHRIIGKDLIRWDYDGRRIDADKHRRGMADHERALQKDLESNPYREQDQAKTTIPGLVMDKSRPFEPRLNIPSQNKEGERPTKNALILPGVGGSWGDGGKDAWSEIARRKGYNPIFLEPDGYSIRGGKGSQQIKAAIGEIIKRGDIDALMGFSAGGINIPYILNHPDFKSAPKEVQDRIKKVIMVGSPEVSQDTFKNIPEQYNPERFNKHSSDAYLKSLPSPEQSSAGTFTVNPNQGGPMPGLDQTNRPNWYGGKIRVFDGDGKPKEFDFGSGAERLKGGNLGSAPFGTGFITGPHSGRAVSDGFQYNEKIGNREQNAKLLLNDPKYGNRKREGIVFHSSPSMRTAGCFGIPPAQYAKFKELMNNMLAKHGPLAVINDPQEGIKIFPRDKVPEGVNIKTEQQFLEDTRKNNPGLYYGTQHNLVAWDRTFDRALKDFENPWERYMRPEAPPSAKLTDPIINDPFATTNPLAPISKKGWDMNKGAGPLDPRLLQKDDVHALLKAGNELEDVMRGNVIQDPIAADQARRRAPSRAMPNREPMPEEYFLGGETNQGQGWAKSGKRPKGMWDGMPYNYGFPDTINLPYMKGFHEEMMRGYTESLNDLNKSVNMLVNPPVVKGEDLRNPSEPVKTPPKVEEERRRENGDPNPQLPPGDKESREMPPVNHNPEISPKSAPNDQAPGGYNASTLIDV